MKKLLTVLLSLTVIICAVLPCFTVNAEEELFSKEQIEYYKNLGLQGRSDLPAVFPLESVQHKDQR